MWSWFFIHVNVLSSSPSPAAAVAPHSAGCFVSADSLCSLGPEVSPSAGGVAAAALSPFSAARPQLLPAAPYSDCSYGSCLCEI